MKNKIKNILERLALSIMYVGLVATTYNMIQGNDFSSEPQITNVILISFVSFCVLRIAVYKITLYEVRNNKNSFITSKIDNGR